MERLRNPAIWVLVAASVLPLWTAFEVDNRLLDEDALITLTYAKNLARGSGFSYNHPPPVLGTTTPLYALVVAVLSVVTLGGEPTFLAVFLSALCWAGTAWAVFGFRRAFRLDDRQAVIVGLMLVASGSVAHLEMESHLFALLLVVSAGLFFAGRSLLSGLACGALFLTRGEGALLFGILLALAIIADLKRRRQQSDDAARSAAMLLSIGFVLPVLLWSAFAQLVFGSVLPNTLAAKIAQGSTGLWRPFAAQLMGDWLPGWGRELGLAGVPYLNLGYALAIAGLVLVMVRRSPLAVVVAWVLCYVVGYSLLGVPGYPWYGLPVSFVLFLLAGIGLAELCSLADRIGRRGAVAAAVVVAALVILRVAIPTVRAALAEESSPRKHAYLELAGWFQEHATPGAAIAYHEIGYLGYYTDNRIIDMMGLVTPEITPHVAVGDFSWGFWHFRPEYFVYLEGSGFQTAIVSDPHFSMSYRAVQRFPGFDGRSLTVYERVGRE
jgi:hypothetical protein